MEIIGYIEARWSVLLGGACFIHIVWKKKRDVASVVYNSWHHIISPMLSDRRRELHHVYAFPYTMFCTPCRTAARAERCVSPNGVIQTSKRQRAR